MNKKMRKKLRKLQNSAPGFKASGSANGGRFQFPGKLTGRKLTRFDKLLVSPNWSAMNLEEIKKDFYQEHPDVKARDEAATREYRNQKKISIMGRCPKPVQAFEECKFPEPILSSLKAKNFVEPTPIQAQALPVALSGKDMVGIAETGSGKTLAYILPAIIHIYGKNNPRNAGEPDVVVLAPTRELAQQIHQVVVSLGPDVKVNSVCFYGGSKRIDQKACAGQVFEICIATPGRLCDFLNEGLIKFNNCAYCVLDEADRMLDLGFEPQISMVINQIRPDRQMLMFSATWPPDVKDLAEKYLKDYVRVNIGSLGTSANHNIIQRVEICEETEKPQRLVKIMKSVLVEEENKTLIFVKTKVDVDYLTLRFRLNGWNALGLHGDMKQNERDRVFGDFKSGKFLILIATDLAARGLDIDDIKYIINYDYPRCSEDYVHRIGRTGRCNRTGTAITFFSSDHRAKANDLISVLEEADQYVPPALKEIAALPPLAKKGKKLLKPAKSMKFKKREVKQFMQHQEMNVNSLPLGTVTDSETLPDLPVLDESLLMSSPVSSKKKKKKHELDKLHSMSVISQKQSCDAPMNTVPPDSYKRANIGLDSQMSSPMPGIGPVLNNAFFLANFNVHKTNASFMQDFTKKSPIGDITGNSRNNMCSMPGQYPNLGMNNRDPVFSNSYQQHGMGLNFGMPSDSVDRRNEGFPFGVRNMGMPMNAATERMPMNSGIMQMPIHPRNVAMLMDPTTIRPPQNISEHGSGWPGMNSLSYNSNMSCQNSDWKNSRNNYGPGLSNINPYSGQNTWSGNRNQYPGRYGSY